MALDDLEVGEVYLVEWEFPSRLESEGWVMEGGYFHGRFKGWGKRVLIFKGPSGDIKFLGPRFIKSLELVTVQEG